MASGLVRASLACAAAAALLTTSTSGYAAWQTAAESSGPAAAALESGATRVFITSPGGEPREVDAQAGVRVTVGDTVSVRMPVTIRTGADPLAVLKVAVPTASGDAALLAELKAGPSPITVTPADGGPELTPVPGDATARTVTPASDGRTYLVEWSTSTRATRDGKAPAAKNLWGAGPASLQGLSVGARPLAVTLTPGAPTTGARTSPSPTPSPSGTPGTPATPSVEAVDSVDADVPQVRAVVPPIRMDTTALRVETAPGGSAVSPLGGIPVRVQPVSVEVKPRGQLTEAGLTDLLTKTGVEIRWGTNECTDARWAVKAGEFGAKATGTPLPKGAEFDTIPPGQERRLCTRFAPSTSQDEFVQRFAGRQVLAATRWTSSSNPPATWTSSAATNAVLTVPLRSATAAASACTAGKGGVTLRWAWPAAGSKPVAKAEGIDRWTVNMRPAGSSEPWKRVAVRSEGSSRTVELTAAALRAAKVTPGAQEVMVRAYPFESEAARADSAQVWKVTVPARGAASCNGTAANSGDLVELGGEQ